MFPGGRLGIGLLILRTAAGLATGVYGAILASCSAVANASQFSYIGQLILGLLLFAGSLFFLLGLMMPFVSIIAATGEMIGVFIRMVPADSLKESEFSRTTLVMLASIAVALIFLGPGAYSIDARLFGRKRIFIPPDVKN